MSEKAQQHEAPPQESAAAPSPTKRGKRSKLRWIVPCVALGVSIIAALVLYQNLKDDTWAYYTDGQALRVDAEEDRERMVLWEDPKPHLLDTAPKEDNPEPAEKTTEHIEAAFSPDGSTMVLTYTTETEGTKPNTDLYVSHWNESSWSRPEPIDTLNSEHDEQDAAFSGDGRYLFFSSNRPGGVGGFDLYAAERGEDGKWSALAALGEEINSPNNEIGPAPSRDDRRLFFTSDRTTSEGAHDIYVAQRLPVEQEDPPTEATEKAALAYGKAVAVNELNSDRNDIEAALSDRGGYIFIASDRSRTDTSQYQLYLSRVVDGRAQTPERVDVYIDDDNVKDPVVRMDGFDLLFSTDADLAAGAPAEDGAVPDYRLYGSTTREVIGYTDLSRWELFKTLLDRIMWWLLLAVASLIALLYMLEKWQDITSLFHKCLAGSAMVHLLLLFLMMTWLISQEMTPGDEPRSPEVALTIDALAQEELAMESQQELAQVAKTTQMVVSKAVNEFREVEFNAADITTDPVAIVRQTTPESLVSNLQPSAASESSITEPLPLLDDAATTLSDLSPTLLPELEVEQLEVQVATAEEAVDTSQDEFEVNEQTIQKVEITKLELERIESQKINVQSDAKSVNASQQPAPTIDTGGQTVNPTEGLESEQSPPKLDGVDSPPAFSAGLPGLDPLDALPLTEQKLETPKHELDPKAITKLVRKQGKPSLEVIEQLGGSEGTEKAIALGLDWLSNNQEPDGSWDMAKHGSKSEYNTAGAGLALLCYYGWGIKHGEYADQDKHKRHEDAVSKALDWLIKQQKPDGDLRGKAGGHAMYCHGIAAVALCEAYALTKDPALKEPATLAIDFIVKAQHAAGGWRYNPGQAGDLSVTGWQMMALHSAQMADIEVPEKTFTAARAFLDAVSGGKSGGRYGYSGPSGGGPAMTPTGMFLRQLDLEAPTEARMIESAEYLRANMLKPGRRKFYYEYYGTLALYQHQGPIWEQWNERLKESYLPSQEVTGTHTGSWDPGLDGNFAKTGGRVTTTTLAILSLEVYYRLLPMYGFDREEDKP